MHSKSKGPLISFESFLHSSHFNFMLCTIQEFFLTPKAFFLVRACIIGSPPKCVLTRVTIKSLNLLMVLWTCSSKRMTLEIMEQTIPRLKRFKTTLYKNRRPKLPPKSVLGLQRRKQNRRLKVHLPQSPTPMTMLNLMTKKKDPKEAQIGKTIG